MRRKRWAFVDCVVAAVKPGRVLIILTSRRHLTNSHRLGNAKKLMAIVAGDDCFTRAVVEWNAERASSMRVISPPDEVWTLTSAQLISSAAAVVIKARST